MIISESESALHFHTDIEVLYVMEGKMEVRIRDQVYVAGPHDIILINSGEKHAFRIGKETLACQIFLDYFMLKDALNRTQIIFNCNSAADPEKDYSKHRYVLEAMMDQYMEKSKIFLYKSLYYSFIEVLKENNLEKSEKNLPETGIKVRRTLRYIEEHYGEPVSLAEMAKREYMSESAFSRLFKKETGSVFTEYVRSVRLEHARRDLLHTNKTITEIAVDCGFANLSAFNKSFRQVYQTAPREYRQKAAAPERQESRNAKERFRSYKEKKRKKEKNDSRRICADISTGVSFHDGVLACMCAGGFAELLEGKVQSHVRKTVNELGVRYIWIYNPFDFALQIRANHETKNLNFEKLDAVLDFLVEMGCVPVIELPDRKKKLVINIGEEKWEEEADPEQIFLSMSEWVEALSTLLNHIVERYTSNEVSRWRFVIWYDGEHITSLGQIPYEILYEQTWNVLRNYIPNVQIGASGLSIEMDADRLKNQFLWWKEREDRPDFLTFISYPYRVRIREGPNYDLLQIASDSRFVNCDLDRYVTLLESVGYPDTPIWIMEWNTSLSERNIYNDSCAKACHMLTQMTDAVGRVEVMSYSNVSDCTSQYFDSLSPLTGATGLLTRDGLMKPAYYAMEFWKNLGSLLVRKGENYIITSQNGKAVQIIAFNAKKFSTGYYMQNESQLQADGLPYIFENRDPVEFDFDLYPFQDGRKKICIYRVAESFGNVLAEWGELGYADNLMRSEISYLEKICIPRMEVHYQQAEEGHLVFKIRLEANEMALIQIL